MIYDARHNRPRFLTSCVNAAWKVLGPRRKMTTLMAAVREKGLANYWLRVWADY